MRFSIRDLLWLMVVAGLLTAWWHIRRQNAALHRDIVVKSETLELKNHALELSAKKEKSLRREVELVSQLAQRREAELSKRDAELRESLARREAVLEALQTIKQSQSPSN